MSRLGRSSFDLNVDVTGIDKKADGSIALSVDYLNVGPQVFNGLDLQVSKHADNITTTLKSADENLHLDMYAEAVLEGADSKLDAYLDIAGLNTGIFGIKGKLADSTVKFNIDAHTEGNNIDNVTGFLHLSDLYLVNSDNKKLTLDNLSINIDTLSNYHCTAHDFRHAPCACAATGLMLTSPDTCSLNPWRRKSGG